MQKDKFTKDNFKCDCGSDASGFMAGRPICLECADRLKVNMETSGGTSPHQIINYWFGLALAISLLFFYGIYKLIF